MTIVDVLIPFFLLLGGLIFFHELGHFLVAKGFGVKVEKFSIGFGPAVLKRRVGETEYLIAWLPLGGYVKMLGEIPGEELPEEDRDRAFNAQPVWKRVSIAAAGPAMNLILPAVVLAGVYMVGVPTPTTLIGGVMPDSPAAEAGIVARDRIVAVDGEELWRWGDLTVAIAESDGPLALEVERDGERLAVRVNPELVDGKPVIGIDHSPPATLIAISSPDTPAARAGLRVGDELVAVNGTPVGDWYELLQALPKEPAALEFELLRPLDGAQERLRIVVPAGEGSRDADALGLRALDAEIQLVEPGSPADQAGLARDDLIVGLGGEPLASFAVLASTIRSGEGAPIRLTILREHRELDMQLAPELRAIELEGEIQEAWAIGIHGSARRVSGEQRDDIVRNPVLALWAGTERTSEIFGSIIVGVGKLLTGDVGLRNVAGPIGIGKIAADSYRDGWFEFFWVLSVISVNLAILNLLPIPILDGGQIVFALAEGIKGAPLSLRVREIAVQVGLSLLVLLMGFALWNDLTRYWSRILGYFQELV